MSDPETPDAQFTRTWQKVPQEERDELLARAQEKAFEVCSVVALLGCSVAFGLDLTWILLGVAALLPILFQVVLMRHWVELKPQTVARYILAAHTAKQYARGLGVRNPTPRVLFRGSLMQLREPDPQIDEEFALDYAEELSAENTTNSGAGYNADLMNPKEVWISLFSDFMMMFSEAEGGAHIEFTSPILHDFAAVLDTPEDLDEAVTERQLTIEANAADGKPARWLLTTPHVSALLTCERKVRFFIHRAQAVAESEASAETEALAAPEGTSHSLFASNQVGATL